MTADSLIQKLTEEAFNPTGDDRMGTFIPLDKAISFIRQHEAEQPHDYGAVARDIDKTREEAARPAQEQRVEVPSGPAHTNTLIEEIKTVISVMMHEYFSQTPGLRDTGAWVDAFADKLAAIHDRSEIPGSVKEALENAAKMASEDADYCESQQPPLNGPTCLRILAMKLRGLGAQPVWKSAEHAKTKDLVNMIRMKLERRFQVSDYLPDGGEHDDTHAVRHVVREMCQDVMAHVREIHALAERALNSMGEARA